jgi:hypothetical protein
MGTVRQLLHNSIPAEARTGGKLIFPKWAFGQRPKSAKAHRQVDPRVTYSARGHLLCGDAADLPGSAARLA